MLDGNFLNLLMLHVVPVLDLCLRYHSPRWVFTHSTQQDSSPSSGANIQHTVHRVCSLDLGYSFVSLLIPKGRGQSNFGLFSFKLLLLEHSLLILMNCKRRNKSVFVEADILLLPNPPLGTRLIFPQVPLIDCSVKFSVQSSLTWIEEKSIHIAISTL